MQVGPSRIAIHQAATVIPPIVHTVRRAADRWLATWARADEILVHPLDPVIAAETVATLLRRLPVGAPTSAAGSV